ncbi:molybdenum cofactor guanylyltransferase [Geobacter sp. DSM 9736]|uniref:molybdenum cofactor guanylyltransferase n=1 Tax=Geobacter sp. DSM 9736 TaxID=1277350 RepID=UPI000B502645|nr:molybdenum cofactor guanylyltransferase [Geobacter sp. DSM 9736]SNB46006.1 molybdenum cofactor guanylyltransferase [Geobacter sp. DSM 9736]
MANPSSTAGVILAGGRSSRMGSNKALLPYRGGRFIEAIYRQFCEIFPEVLVVTNSPEQYDFLPCRKVADLHTGGGALAGVHAGLFHAAASAAFVVACDMPYLNPNLVRHMAGLTGEADVVVAESPHGVEPLHAIYGKNCLEAMDSALLSGRRRIVSFFTGLKVRTVPRAEVARFDPDFLSFSNINTPEEYYRLRQAERAEIAMPASARM